MYSDVTMTPHGFLFPAAHAGLDYLTFDVLTETIESYKGGDCVYMRESFGKMKKNFHTDRFSMFSEPGLLGGTNIHMVWKLHDYNFHVLYNYDQDAMSLVINPWINVNENEREISSVKPGTSSQEFPYGSLLDNLYKQTTVSFSSDGSSDDVVFEGVCKKKDAQLTGNKRWQLRNGTREEYEQFLATAGEVVLLKTVGSKEEEALVPQGFNPLLEIGSAMLKSWWFNQFLNARPEQQQKTYGSGFGFGSSANTYGFRSRPYTTGGSSRRPSNLEDMVNSGNGDGDC